MGFSGGIGRLLSVLTSSSEGAVFRRREVGPTCSISAADRASRVIRSKSSANEFREILPDDSNSAGQLVAKRGIHKRTRFSEIEFQCITVAGGSFRKAKLALEHIRFSSSDNPRHLA
jgi:hypothetical protein